MSQVTNLNSTSSGFQPSSSDAINDVNLDDFLKLMLTELQNQDPLNPLENDELLAQISQIRQVGATDKLTSTLDAVLLGQNITSATNLIGAEIDAISDDKQRVTGVVNRVTISDGAPKLHVDGGAQIGVSDEEGELETGKYRYKVVWANNDTGQLLGVESSVAIDVTENGQAITLKNLPITDQPKEIYRTDRTGEGKFYLVGTLADGRTSSYTDKTADEDLSNTVLSRTPKLIDNVSRSYEVSLKNVGEIRPPK